MGPGADIRLPSPPGWPPTLAAYRDWESADRVHAGLVGARPGAPLAAVEIRPLSPVPTMRERSHHRRHWRQVGIRVLALHLQQSVPSAPSLTSRSRDQPVAPE